MDEYYLICSDLRKAQDLRDYYRRMGHSEKANYYQGRVEKINHEKLKLELQLSNELARAS